MSPPALITAFKKQNKKKNNNVIWKHQLFPPPPCQLSEVGNFVNRSTIGCLAFCHCQLTVWREFEKKRKKQQQQGTLLWNKCSNFYAWNLFSLFSVLWRKCWILGHLSQFCFCGGGHISAFSERCAPTLTSEALHWAVHKDCAGSFATHGHLQALSSCSNSSLSQ